MVGAVRGVGLVAPIPGWRPRLLRGGGTVLLLLAVMYLATMIRRAAVVEELVRQRTQELHDSKAKTQELNAVLLSSLSKQRKLTDELSHAKDAAETANRTKSDFLANMSHEIRTPMTAILGFAENLLDPDLSADDRSAALGIIRRNGEHLLQIVNDILDVSKIEAGRMAFESVPLRPRELVDDVARTMRS